MFQVEDIERARKIISVLKLPECFGCDEYTEDLIGEQIAEVVDNDFYVSCGVSKAVIVVDSLPFVIKIPFNGTWEDYDYDDDNDSCDEPCFSFFELASDYSPSNYCEDEFEKTEHVEEAGFGVLVPEMMYLGKVEGASVFIQEKVTPLCEHRRLTPSKDSLNKAEKYLLPFTKEWIGLVIDFYGEDFWRSFLKWANEWEPDILTDMHTSNYGLNKDGRPVMFDISGFRN